jgi:PAS domain S-box-containing protein
MYRILYVDDETTLLEIGKIFLEQSGQFIVDTITSAPAALALLKSANYDVIISDYQMPEMDGIELLRQVRSSGNTTPFILFTGRGREEVVIQALNEGVDFYLQKGGEPRSQFAELSNKIFYAVRRKRAEEALRESEERFRRIVETTDEGIAQMDENFTMVYVNRRMAEMNGCTPEEMIGRNFSSFMVAEEIPDHTSRTNERKLGECGRYERQFMTKDGKIRWVHISATPLIDPNGTFRGSLAMCSDITDRKTAEEAIDRRNEELHAAYQQLAASEEEIRRNYDTLEKSQARLLESEQRYRNVVEDQTEFISRFLPDGTHVFVNDAYCRYFGKKRKDIVGHRLQPKIPAGDRESVKRFFASLTPDHPIDSIEHRIIMPDGTERWHWWSDRAIFDPSGTVTEFQSVGRDITGEKATRTALEKSEIRFREQYQSNPLAIFTWQLRDDDFVLADCNRAAEILSGGRVHQYLGKSTSELYVTRPELVAGIRRCFSEQTVISKDLVSEHFLPGRLIHTTTAFVPPDLIMVHMADITESRRSEEALNKSQRMLAEAMELANLVNWEYDTGTGILTFDNRFSTLYGAKAESQGTGHMGIETYLRDLVHPDDRWILVEEDKKIRASPDPGYVSKREYRIIRRDGEVRHIEMCIGVTNDADGQTIRAHGVNQDITERRKSEEELRESRRRLAEAMNLANLVNWECDLGTGILTFDDRFSTMYGADAEHKGIHQMTADAYVADLVHPDDRWILAEEDEKTRAVSDPGYVSKREYRIIRGDGKIRHIEMCVGVTKDAAGRTIRTHGVNLDITEQKDTKKALLRANSRPCHQSGISRHEILTRITALHEYCKLAETMSRDPGIGEYLKKMDSAITEIQSQIGSLRTGEDSSTNDAQ